MVSEFFATHARYVPPPAGTKPPIRWGTDAGLVELLGAGTSSIETEQRPVFEYFRSIDHAIDVFRTYFGPTARAFQMLDAERQASLRKDLEAIFQRYNRATDGTAVVEAQYLMVIAIRR
jgi:hypothetical protein